MEWLNAHIEQIWFLIIGFLVLYYAVADGLDLGVGIIALSTRDEEKRGIMMASLQNIWQENQTWLVVLGGMLFGAFPLFYSIALSAFYVPIIVMIFGLIFRGLAFEFRNSSKGHSLWSLSFGGGKPCDRSFSRLHTGGHLLRNPHAGTHIYGNCVELVSPLFRSLHPGRCLRLHHAGGKLPYPENGR